MSVIWVYWFGLKFLFFIGLVWVGGFLHIFLKQSMSSRRELHCVLMCTCKLLLLLLARPYYTVMSVLIVCTIGTYFLTCQYVQMVCVCMCCKFLLFFSLLQVQKIINSFNFFFFILKAALSLFIGIIVVVVVIVTIFCCLFIF